jgi:hypothetical protein
LLSIPLITPEGIVLSEDRISSSFTYFPLGELFCGRVAQYPSTSPWGNLSLGGFLSKVFFYFFLLGNFSLGGYFNIPLFPHEGTFL